VTGENCPFDPEGIEEQDHVGGEVLDVIAAIRLVRVTMAALRHTDDVRLGRKAVEHGLIRAPRVGRPREQKQRRIGGVTLALERQPQTRGERDARHGGTLSGVAAAGAVTRRANRPP
jgi:hypothetical protein